MKIKIFSGQNFKCIEECVNDFIKECCVCKILQSESNDGCFPHITITIVYDDNYNCEYIKSTFQRFNKKELC